MGPRSGSVIGLEDAPFYLEHSPCAPLQQGPPLSDVSSGQVRVRAETSKKRGFEIKRAQISATYSKSKARVTRGKASGFHSQRNRRELPDAAKLGCQKKHITLSEQLNSQFSDSGPDPDTKPKMDHFIWL